MKTTRREFVVGALGVVGFGTGCAVTKGQEMNETDNRQFTMQPVGKVKQYKDYAELQIYDKYADALLGLDGFSHAFVMYWFDKHDTPQRRSILRVHPRGNKDNPLTGVFACRAPFRPNLIALNLCKIISVEGSVVRVEKSDAFDGTPILDIKPYTGMDRPEGEFHVPEWLKKGRPPKQ